eukprot:gene9150-16275_t
MSSYAGSVADSDLDPDQDSSGEGASNEDGIEDSFINALDTGYPVRLGMGSKPGLFGAAPLRKPHHVISQVQRTTMPPPGPIKFAGIPLLRELDLSMGEFKYDSPAEQRQIDDLLNRAARGLYPAPDLLVKQSIVATPAPSESCKSKTWTPAFRKQSRDIYSVHGNERSTWTNGKASRRTAITWNDLNKQLYECTITE